MVQPFFILTKMKSEKTFQVRIESLAFEGKGIARIDGKVVFVRNAVPGDLVEIQLTKNKKDYAEARLIKVIEASSERIAPQCVHFGICGGCSFQNLPYSIQLSWKEKIVCEALQKIGKFDEINIKKVIPSPYEFRYRNKVELSFGTDIHYLENFEPNQAVSPQGNLLLGFHIPERFDKIVDIQNCLLLPENGNQILNIIRQKAKEFGLQAYNLRKHTGFLRNLVIRHSFSSKETLVNLVTTTPQNASETNYLKWYANDFPTYHLAEHILHTINDTYSPTTTGAVRLIKGTGLLYENLNGIQYRISPFSFFQVNPLQAENLVNKVIEYSEPQNKIVWDLYSGAGTFSLPLARESKFVFGIESNSEAVDDARLNAELNNIQNIVFYAKDLHSKDITKELLKLEKPQIVVIDPPRTGLHKNLLKALINILPPKIVYVSCNPATLARDLFELKNFYRLTEIQPVDMFPQTYHIETVSLLELMKG